MLRRIDLLTNQNKKMITQLILVIEGGFNRSIADDSKNAHIYASLSTPKLATDATQWLEQYPFMKKGCEITKHKEMKMLHFKPQSDNHNLNPCARISDTTYSVSGSMTSKPFFELATPSNDKAAEALMKLAMILDNTILANDNIQNFNKNNPIYFLAQEIQSHKLNPNGISMRFKYKFPIHIVQDKTLLSDLFDQILPLPLVPSQEASSLHALTSNLLMPAEEEDEDDTSASSSSKAPSSCDSGAALKRIAELEARLKTAHIQLAKDQNIIKAQKGLIDTFTATHLDEVSDLVNLDLSTHEMHATGCDDHQSTDLL